MNINIYIEDAVAKQLTACAKTFGQSRNAIIREAVREWIAQHRAAKWPHAVLSFKGVPDFPSFESYRKELEEPKEDPLA